MSHWAIVPAAGAGRRFGGSKLTTDFRGVPLLEHCLAVLAEGIGKAVITGAIVVHPPGEHVLITLSRRFSLVPIAAPDAERGLRESLRAGFAALEARADATAIEGALIVPGDQPFLRLDVISRVLAEARKDAAPVVRPAYADEPHVPGHPVWLARHVWRLIEDLEPDEGLSRAITARGLRVATVSVSGANPDVDTREQLARLESHSA